MALTQAFKDDQFGAKKANQILTCLDTRGNLRRVTILLLDPVDERSPSLLSIFPVYFNINSLYGLFYQLEVLWTFNTEARGRKEYCVLP